MVDRLMPVGSQGSRWQAELPVEVDGRGEGEDARGDAADQSVRGSREMALQQSCPWDFFRVSCDACGLEAGGYDERRSWVESPEGLLCPLCAEQRLSAKPSASAGRSST